MSRPMNLSPRSSRIAASPDPRTPKALATWPRRVQPARPRIVAMRAMTNDVNPQTFSFPRNLSDAVTATLDNWKIEEKVKRLWSRDASLWKSGDESKWLGWLNIVGEQKRSIRRFTNFAEEVKDARFSHVLLLGMGGSSLC